MIEKKKLNKVKIAKFIRYKGSTSKPEIAAELGISMPTVLQNVKELTGGIKAQVIFDTTPKGKDAFYHSRMENGGRAGYYVKPHQHGRAGFKGSHNGEETHQEEF